MNLSCPASRPPGRHRPRSPDMSIEKLQSHWGFTVMPFGRDLAPGMLHRFKAHAEAAARIGWLHRPARPRRDHRRGRRGQDSRRPRRDRRPGPLPAHRHLPAEPDRRSPRHPPRDRDRARRAPSFHHATLIPQAAEALAAETAERGRQVPILIIDEAHLLDTGQPRSHAAADQPPTWTPGPRSPACSSASPPCGAGSGSAPWPPSTSGSPCATPCPG